VVLDESQEPSVTKPLGYGSASPALLNFGLDDTTKHVCGEHPATASICLRQGREGSYFTGSSPEGGG
jgi:hypothetical protein